MWNSEQSKGRRGRWRFEESVWSLCISSVHPPPPCCFGAFFFGGPGQAVQRQPGWGEQPPQESSDLLRAMASSRSSCSCWVSLASRSFSSRSLSRFAHSIMSSSVGYCSMKQSKKQTKNILGGDYFLKLGIFELLFFLQGLKSKCPFS